MNDFAPFAHNARPDPLDIALDRALLSPVGYIGAVAQATLHLEGCYTWSTIWVQPHSTESCTNPLWDLPDSILADYLRVFDTRPDLGPARRLDIALRDLPLPAGFVSENSMRAVASGRASSIYVSPRLTARCRRPFWDTPAAPTTYLTFAFCYTDRPQLP